MGSKFASTAFSIREPAASTGEHDPGRRGWAATLQSQREESGTPARPEPWTKQRAGRERPPPLPAPVPTRRRAQGPVPATPTVARAHPGAVSQAPPPLKGQGSRTRLSGTPLKMGEIKCGRLKSVRTFGASSTLVLLAAMGARLVLSLIRHLFRSPGRCRGMSQKRHPLLNRTLRPSPHRLGQ